MRLTPMFHSPDPHCLQHLGTTDTKCGERYQTGTCRYSSNAYVRGNMYKSDDLLDNKCQGRARIEGRRAQAQPAQEEKRAKQSSTLSSPPAPMLA